MSSQVMIVAGEASSALYAQRLLEYWRHQKRNIVAFGVGTQEMENLGFERLGKAEEMAVVGIQEVIAHWGIIKGAYDRLLSEARSRRPQVALLLDYPDFNLRLAKQLKKMGIPVVYYISPQVWAWRRGRVKNIKECVDRMLVLFPFEKDFYDQHGVSCGFVGHPLLDELNEELFSGEEINRARSRFGLNSQGQDIVLGLMPGSRRSEVKHHLQTQLKVAEKLFRQFPKLKVALLLAPTLDKEEIRDQLSDLKVPLIIMQMSPLEMIKIIDLALVASGTATLLVGLLEKPMNIMYRMNSLTAFLAKRFVKHTSYFGMINLVLGEEVCPEFFQERASVEILSESLGRLISSPLLMDQMALSLSRARQLLGSQGATVRVAQELDAFLAPRSLEQSP